MLSPALLLIGCAAGRSGGPGPGAEKPQEVAFRNSRIVKERGCLNCHTIGSTGGTAGPILNQVGSRRRAEWLRAWLTDPNRVKPGTKMPDFEFSAAELDELVAGLATLQRPVDGPALVAAQGGVAGGRALFEAYGCLACHRLGREGRFVGPDLTWVGRRKSEDWERTWLRAPDAYKPGTFMPDFDLSEPEIDALSAYLHTLQGQHSDESRSWEGFVGLILDLRPRGRGQLVYRRLACWSCHGERGRQGVANPNAAPDGLVPAIDTAVDRLGDDGVRAAILEASWPEKLDPQGPAPPFVHPAWRDALTGGELDDLVAYLASLGPKRKRWRFR